MDWDQWPTTVSEMRHVSRLVCYPLPVNHIPSSAFSHVPLHVLKFGKTGIEAIPNVVCNLRQLTTLSFDTDSVVDVNAIVPYCQHDNHHPSTLLSMTLRGTGMTSIPDQVFKSFPTIDDLRITGTDDKYLWINDLVTKLRQHTLVYLLLGSMAKGLHRGSTADIPGGTVAYRDTP